MVGQIQTGSREFCLFIEPSIGEEEERREPKQGKNSPRWNSVPFSVGEHLGTVHELCNEVVEELILM